MRKLVFLLFAALFFATPLFAAGKVDINHADVATLSAQLKGIGPAKAQAIVAYREAHGPFTDTAQLINVEGIGTAILAGIKDQLVLDTASQ